MKDKIIKLISKKIDTDFKIKYGIYDITGLEYIKVIGYESQTPKPFFFPENNIEQVYLFIEKYPNFFIASAYGTYTTILLSGKPKEFNGKHSGSGFNYGSTNIINNCPKDILILS